MSTSFNINNQEHIPRIKKYISTIVYPFMQENKNDYTKKSHHFGKLELKELFKN